MARPSLYIGKTSRMDGGFILQRQTKVMTQRSSEVKNWMLKPRVSNRDTLARAEFQIGNFLVTKYIFQTCARARLRTRNPLETTQTKMDSAESSARRGGVESQCFQSQRWHSGCNPAVMRKQVQRNSGPFQRRSQAKGLLFGLTIAFATFPGCGGGGASSGTLPPPPPTISVVVTPPSANMLLGKTLQLTATVSGSRDNSVNWSVNGIAGGNAASGTISPSGLYTAPADLPAPANVQITATSAADSASNASSQVTLTSDIVVGISSTSSSLELGAGQNFAATITSTGQPDPSILWKLNASSCPNACGSIDANGNFTGPQILPSPANVTIVAQSAVDPSKQASQIITITSHFTLQLAAPGTESTSATAVVVATLTPVAGSNPSAVINWSLSGSGGSGSACVTTQNAGTNSAANSDAESANYTAPGSAPTPNTVTITATRSQRHLINSIVHCTTNAHKRSGILRHRRTELALLRPG